MELNQSEKSKLYGILKNLSDKVADAHENWKKKTNSSILLIDGTNTFLRCWSANPAMDENGNHTGGIVGFLKSIGYGIKLLAPTRCVVIFDGVGGSFKRRKLFPDYKKNRKGRIRLNRTYEDLDEITDEEESCRKQYIHLIDYLKVLPINLLSIDHVEADDVIAFLATDYFKSSKKVYIMSSDKDFLQLCTGNICVYSPTKKRIYGPAEVISEYQIHPNNFVLFRALDGDASDNVKGIEGAGPKTIVKYFPWLNEEKQHTIEEVISHASILKNKYKVCERVSGGKNILELNVALMQLKDTALTPQAQLYCNDRLDTSQIPHMDRNMFYKLVREDMIENNLPNHITWVNDVFSSLDLVTRSE